MPLNGCPWTPISLVLTAREPCGEEAEELCTRPWETPALPPTNKVASWAQGSYLQASASALSETLTNCVSVVPSPGCQTGDSSFCSQHSRPGSLVVYLGAGMRHEDTYTSDHGVLWGIKKQDPNTDSECLFAKSCREAF